MPDPTTDRVVRLLNCFFFLDTADLVSRKGPSCAPAVAEALCPDHGTVSPVDRALAEVVRAWGAGHTALLTEALNTWDATGSLSAAHRVLMGLPVNLDAAAVA